MQMRSLGLEAIFVCDVSYRVRDAIWCYVRESACHCFRRRRFVPSSSVGQTAQPSCLLLFEAATVKQSHYLDEQLKLLYISPDIASGVRHEYLMH